MALIPEDRKSEGLLLPMSVRDNISMASIGRFTTKGILGGIFIDRKRQDARVDEMIRRLAIKVGDADSPVAQLSGGNQPQVVIAQSSEEHTSKLQSLMRIPSAVFCLKKQKPHN